MKSLFLIFALLLPTALMAAEGAEALPELDAKAIKLMIYQAINVAIVVGIIVYFLKDTVRQFFKEKKATYLLQEEKARSVRKQAEEEHLQIQIQLTKLESTAEETLSRARAEAVDMRNQMMNEAQVMSKRIQAEAEASARLEFEKARAALRKEIILESARQAEKFMKEKVSSEDLQRLQNDFAQNIQAVQS